MNYGSDEDSKSKDEDIVTLKNGWISGKDEDFKSKDEDIVTLKNGWTSGKDEDSKSKYEYTVTLKNGWTSGKDEDSKSKDEYIVTLKNGWTSGKDEDSESKDEDLDWEVWFKPWILDSSFYNKKISENTSIYFLQMIKILIFKWKQIFFKKDICFFQIVIYI